MVAINNIDKKYVENFLNSQDVIKELCRTFEQESENIQDLKVKKNKNIIFSFKIVLYGDEYIKVSGKLSKNQDKIDLVYKVIDGNSVIGIQREEFINKGEIADNEVYLHNIYLKSKKIFGEVVHINPQGEVVNTIAINDKYKKDVIQNIVVGMINNYNNNSDKKEM